MRRALAILSVTMITAGAVILADAAMTLAWKEPVSAIWSALKQDEARSELRELTDEFLGAEQVEGVANGDPERQARRLARIFGRRLPDGKGIGRIEIPSIDADYVVIEGTGTADLKRGPGRYPETSLPGQGNTVGIAGHRTTYGAPFRNIDEIADGDEVRIEMPYATLVYEVEKSKIVEPSDTHIVRDVGRERLVMTACHPLYSAAQRYAVFADLTAIEIKA